MAMQHDLVGTHADLEPLCCSLERVFQIGVDERLDDATVVADEVVVVFAACVGGLEPRDPVAELDALDEAPLNELVECAVHTRDPDPPAVTADPVEDLLGRTATGLRPQVLDHRPARTAVPQPAGEKVVECPGAPGRV